MIERQQQRRVFQCHEHESQFWREGYVRIPFLNSDELEACRKLFNEVDPKVDAPFYSSIDSRSIAYRKEVDRRLRSLLQEKTENYFVDYYPIAFTFIVKRPAKGSEVLSHVDDIHVDQQRFASVNVWTPLVDTNAMNGALGVLPRSHRLPSPHRGLGLPFPYSRYGYLFEDHMIDVHLKAGEALFYHDNLIHRSLPNESDKVRPAVITGMIPKEGQPIICFQHDELKENEVEIFEVSGDFWFNFDKHKKPLDQKSLGIEEYHPMSMSDDEFASYFDWH